MTENTKKPDPLDLIWGGTAIAAELNVTERKAFDLLEKEQIPARKVNGRWVVSRERLRQFFMADVAA